MRVFCTELRGLHAHVLGEFQDVAFVQLHRGLAAAVGASAAVDLVLNVLGHLAKLQFLKVVSLEMFPKSFVFRSFLLAEPFDLDEVRDEHLFRYRPVEHRLIPKVNPQRPRRSIVA